MCWGVAASVSAGQPIQIGKVGAGVGSSVDWGFERPVLLADESGLLRIVVMWSRRGAEVENKVV